MDEPFFLSSASFWTPSHLSSSPRWLGHIPFAFWLVEAARPRCIVELGAGRGEAYFAFCQAVEGLDPDSRCYITGDWDHADPDGESSFRHIAEINALHFTSFSSLIPESCDRAANRFQDGSIDLLHIAGSPTYETARRMLDAWLPRMSRQGVVLLDGTEDSGGDTGPGRLFREVAGRYPSFAFLHDGGLGVVGVGDQLSSRVERLFNPAQSAEQRDTVQRCYARLGQGLIDQHQRRSSTRSKDGPSSLSSRPIPSVERKLEFLNEQVSCLTHELDQIQQSLAWALAQKVSRIRMILFREGSLPARCWRAFSRFCKVTMTQGLGAATAKAGARILQGPSGRAGKAMRSQESTSVEDAVLPSQGFRDLPWWDLREPVDRERIGGGAFKVLLVSHEASRTGAPLCMLRLAEQLTRNGDFDCWIILDRGGELAGEFAAIAPTLDIQTLPDAGIAREQAPRLIAGLFREFADDGLAICNTACLAEYYAACEAHQVPVLAWVHEMPTSIDQYCGGRETVELILRAARRMITPARTVRDALTIHYELDGDRIHTFYNGLCNQGDRRPRHEARQQVRDELGLPEDAQLVLGCGTIDIRKGVDLFVQVARMVLARALGSPVTFLWIGKALDESLLRWLEHDLARGRLLDRVRFLGPRDDPSPYFKAANVFILTSREDPCPLVNMEAMASGLPVVGFQDAGGAPELLEDCGLVVRYADLGAMAQAVVHLLANPELSESLGRRARAKIESHFTWTRAAEQLTRILEEDYQYRPTNGRAISVDAQHHGRESHRNAPLTVSNPRASAYSNA